MSEHEEHALPQPTVWPFVMASGITLFAVGMAISFIVMAAGAILFILSVWGWVNDLTGDHESQEHMSDAERGTHETGRLEREHG